MGDAAEQKGTEEHGHEEGGGGGKSKLPFIIAGLVVLLILVAVIGVMILGGGDTEQLIEAPKKDPPGYQLEFKDPFTTNLAPPDDQYIYSVTVTLEMKPRGDFQQADMLAEIGVETDSKEIRMPAILDTITGIIASKTRMEVNSTGGKDIMRREIMKAVSDLLEKGEVVKVYLSGYSIN